MVSNGIIQINRQDERLQRHLGTYHYTVALRQRRSYFQRPYSRLFLFLDSVGSHPDSTIIVLSRAKEVNQNIAEIYIIFILILWE